MASTLDMLPGRLLAAEPLLEMDRSENPLRDRLTQPRFAIRHGKVAVPAATGLGIDIDEHILQEYQVG